MPTDAETTLPGSMAQTMVGSGQRRSRRGSGFPDEPVADPSRIGRFVVLRRLGVGAMGAVYAAYDEQLDRKVAVKVLTDRRSERRQGRLRREAQALARLSHPNVVQVYEVGTHEDQIFLAMELVEGKSLRAFVREGSPPLVEVLEVFDQAGRGLAAAHAAGLVHRDFKPDNVIVGDDGRVRVLDFGLAQASLEESLEEPTTEELQPSDAFRPRLTRTGAMVGTPAYMSPEQIGLEPLTPASDQFSFCITLYEALYGQHPFDTESLSSLSVSISKGAIREPPEGSRVPSRIRSALWRGLATEPEARWPSMEALLTALQWDPASSRRWAWRAVAVAVLGAGAYGLGVGAGSDAPCEGSAEALGSAWNEERRAQVRSALLGTELGYAPDTWARVEAGLDDYASEWIRQHRDACEATHVRRAASEELLALRERCLSDRRRELAALVEVLAQADADAARKAVSAVGGLPRVDRCAEEDYVRATVEPPSDPKVEAEVEALRERLSHARALRAAAKYDEGLRESRAVLERARALEVRHLVGLAAREQGSQLLDAGDYAAGEASLREAYHELVAVSDDREATEAALELSHGVGVEQSRPEEAQWLLVHARAAQERFEASPREQADLLLAEAALGMVREDYDTAAARGQEAIAVLERGEATETFVYSRALEILGDTRTRQGEHEEAGRLLREGLELRQRLLGAEHPDLVLSLVNLSRVLRMQARYDESVALLERARVLAIEGLGPEHPNVGSVEEGLGTLCYLQGKPAEAKVHYERSLAVKRRTAEPDSPVLAGTLSNLAGMLFLLGELDEAVARYEEVLAIYEGAATAKPVGHGDALNNLGTVLSAKGDHEGALRSYERALALHEEALGPRALKAATALNNMASVQIRLGQLDAALRSIQRSLAIKRETLGDEHPKVAHGLRVEGDIARDQGRLRDALALYDQAWAIYEAALPKEHHDRASLLVSRGEAEQAQGQPDAAERSYREAIRIFEASLGPEHAQVAAASGSLARLLLETGREDEALVLARRAETILVGGEADPAVLAEVRLLLAELQ